MALVLKHLPTNSGGIRDKGSIPGLGRPSRRGNSNPLQYSCLENPMEREAWQVTVHRVTQSRTRLEQLSIHRHKVFLLLPGAYPLLREWVKVAQSCPTLFNSMDCSPRGSSVHGILQARILVGCHFLLQCMKVKTESEVIQSCLILSDRMDCSLPGSSIHGIFQARVLEWGAITFSEGSPQYH